MIQPVTCPYRGISALRFRVKIFCRTPTDEQFSSTQQLELRVPW